MAIETNGALTTRRSAQADPPRPKDELRGEEISLLDVLVVLAARRRLILTLTAVFAIVAVILAFMLPKQYTATTTIMPPQQNSSLASSLTSQLASLSPMSALAGSSLGLKSPNEMYVAMFHSQAVEDAMIDRYRLMQLYHCTYRSQARKALEKHFSILANGKDGLIHISVEDRDPKRAAEMANGYVDQFRALSQTLAITEASQRRAFFEQQLAQAKDRLADAEEALRESEQKTGMIQLDSQTRALVESAATLRAQIAAKEVQVEMMNTYAASGNASMVEAQRELAGLRAQLAKLGGNEDDTGAGLVAPKGVVSQTSLIYVRKLRDVKYYETIFEILARQYELAKLDEAKEGALIQTLDPATVPDRKSFPKRALMIAGGMFAGLIFGIGIAFAQALLARLRRDPETDAKLKFVKSSFSFGRSAVSERL